MTHNIITHPVSTTLAAVGSIGALFGMFDPLVQLLVQTSGQWFTFISVFAGIINPRLELLPSGLVDGVFIVAAGLFLAITAVRLWDKAAPIIRTWIP